MRSNGLTLQDAGGGRSARKSLRRFLPACALVTASLAVAACGSGSNSSGGGGGGSSKPSTGGTVASNYGTTLFGSLPPVGKPTSGGTITQGQISGATPTFIFPIVPGANTSTATIEFISNMFLPIYNGPDGAKPAVNQDLSIAQLPVGSNGDKTYTIKVKPGFKWANGAPVDAKDIEFSFDLLAAAVKESPANWGQYVPGEFPTDITSMSTPDPMTLVINLNKAYNPGFFLNNQLQDTNNVFALPSTDWNVASAGGAHLTNWTDPAVAKKIYDYLSKAGGQVASFGTNPLWQDVDGPFKLKDFNATSSAFDMVPNPSYGGSPKPAFAELSTETFTSTTAQLNALKSGSLDIGGLDPSELAQAPALKAAGYTVYGGPGFGWFGGIINFKDTTDDFNNVIAQQYIRGAIDSLIDQPAIIANVYKTAAVTSYGPVPSYPTSDYTPTDAVTPPYPYSTTSAAATLKAHGWKVVPGGQTTCAKAGTAPDECGAGIPVGTPIKFVWADQPSSASTTGALESQDLASVAKQYAGIDIDLQTKTFNFLASNYDDQSPAAKKYINDWGVNNFGGIYQDYYPTQDGIDNPGGGFNFGDFDDPQANALINKSVFSSDPLAVKNEASYLTKALPVFYFPNPDTLIVVSKKVGGSALSWLTLTQQAEDPQYWYTTK